MDLLLINLQNSFPAINFIAGNQFCWSPKTHEVFYSTDFLKNTNEMNSWSLLHETAHALLEHNSYHADYELIRLEVAAWEKARLLASDLSIEINEDHIQDCLDTYRDWIYKRSICPTCSTKCLQQQDYTSYRCFNCHTVWNVSPSRFCRAYRSTKKNNNQPNIIFHTIK